MCEGGGRKQEKVGFRKSWVRSGSPFFTAEHLLHAQHMGRCRKMRREGPFLESQRFMQPMDAKG